ncbi:MAG: FecR family protein, partial [Chloroflexi bacterium]|nr:FecR family protein [Chloroflexota bacterium]
GLEKRLRIGAFKAEADRESRRSSRSVPIVRESSRNNNKKMWAIAAGAVVAILGLSAFLMSGGNDPKPAARRDRAVSEAAAPAAAERPVVPDLDRQREAAEAKRRDRARRVAEEREAMDRAAREESKPSEGETARPAAPRKPTTVAAMARLMSTTGTVNILAYGKTIPAQPGQDLLSGQGIETVGPLSWAALRFTDGTRLELWADTRVARLTEPADASQGKQAIVTEGTLLGAVAKQPAGRPLVVTTPQGEARVLGTVLSITVEPDGAGTTRLEVGQGKVQFTESVKGASIDVTSGLFTVATAGSEMNLKGIPPMENSRKRPAPAGSPEGDRIDAAVRRAVEFLRKADSPGMNGSPDSDELILWAFIHAGVDPYDPKYRQLLMKILDDRRENATYSVAIRAMILEELNRIAYQGQLLRCAQVLVDNQCRNGQWDYRVVTPIP